MSRDNPTTFSRSIAQLADQAPSRTALITKCNDGKYRAHSYWYLHKQQQIYASFFRRTLNPGAVVPLFMQSGFQQIAALFGAMATGHCAAPLNVKLRAPQIASVLSHDSVGDVLIDEVGLVALHSYTSIEENLPDCVFHLIVDNGLSDLHQNILRKLEEKLSIRRFTGQAPTDANLLTETNDLDTPAICLFTSGSTGKPKGVLISQSDLLQRADAEVECFGVKANDVLLNILPFSFDVGLNQLLSCARAGASIVIGGSWLPADIVNTAREQGVTGISGVPSIWRDILNVGMQFESETLRFVTVSGGDLPQKYLERLHTLNDAISIFKTYGQTETFRTCVLLPHEFSEKMASVGRAFGDAQFAVLRKDGTRAKPNEIGQLIHMGSGSMLRYLDANSGQDKIGANPVPEFAARFPQAVFTGDAAYIDDDGYVYLQGREDGMVKIQGNRVYPSELGVQLHACDGVQDAEVIPVKIDAENTQLAAFVVSTRNELNTAALRNYLSRRVPTYMLPHHIEMCSSLPRTVTGKPDRELLKSRAKKIFNEAIAS